MQMHATVVQTKEGKLEAATVFDYYSQHKLRGTIQRKPRDSDMMRKLKRGRREFMATLGMVTMRGRFVIAPVKPGRLFKGHRP